jgi:hypothetical protein
MMAFEGPFLTSVIARLPYPEYNLAAYGVAYSIALIVESPVIMMLSASTALVENRNTFLKLRNFVYSVNLALAALMVIIIIPPVFNFLASDLLKLPHRVIHLTHMAVAILIPWAPSIGYRRFYQGILIRNNMTRKVVLGTVIRISVMTATALILSSLGEIPGVVVGAASLSTAVVLEAAGTKMMTLKIARTVKNNTQVDAFITYSGIFRFYFPLLLTSFISLAIHPVVTFFMGQSRMPLESLAVLPVLNALVFLFRSFGLSYQEVGIALLKESGDYMMLRDFAIKMAIGVLAAFAVITLTPLSGIWLRGVAGLSKQLANFAAIPLMLYTFFPATTVWINFQRAVLVNSRNTRPITLATLCEVILIILVLFVAIRVFDIVGAVAAVAAYTTGRLAANLYLMRPFNKVCEKFKV